MTMPGIEPWFHKPLANTLTTRPIERCLSFSSILYHWFSFRFGGVLVIFAKIGLMKGISISFLASGKVIFRVTLIFKISFFPRFPVF